MNKTSNIIHNTSVQPKLSIVVPVYNVERYLRKCVDSLLAQDYSDYEIILVDDGSTDGCGAICDEYVHAFEIGDCKLEIRCIHQANAGLSAARNTGIMAAKGEYICFVDSDDYLEPNVLGGLVAQMERDNLDVLRYRLQYVRLVENQESRVKRQYEVCYPFKDPYRGNDYSIEPIDGETFLNTRMNTQCYAWTFVVRRDLLFKPYTLNITHNTSEKDACLFTPGIHFEDVDWTPRVLLKAQRVASTSVVVYNYVMREGSITQEGVDVKKRQQNVKDALFVIKRLNKLIDTHPRCTWLLKMRSDLAVSVLNTTADYLYLQRKTNMEALRKLHVFPLTSPYPEKSTKYKTYLINLSPSIALYLFHMLHKKRK